MQRLAAARAGECRTRSRRRQVFEKRLSALSQSTDATLESDTKSSQEALLSGICGHRQHRTVVFSHQGSRERKSRKRQESLLRRNRGRTLTLRSLAAQMVLALLVPPYWLSRCARARHKIIPDEVAKKSACAAGTPAAAARRQPAAGSSLGFPSCHSSILPSDCPRPRKPPRPAYQAAVMASVLRKALPASVREIRYAHTAVSSARLSSDTGLPDSTSARLLPHPRALASSSRSLTSRSRRPTPICRSSFGKRKACRRGYFCDSVRALFRPAVCGLAQGASLSQSEEWRSKRRFREQARPRRLRNG